MTGSIFALWVLAVPVPADGPAPCVISAGPCVPISDPRLLDPNCRFEPGACISLRWDEYEGNQIIISAEVHVTPRCGSKDSALKLEKKGRDYLAEIQSLPIQTSFILHPCVASGFVDVKVTEVYTPPAP